MPELPEVEVLARYLGPKLRGLTITGIDVLKMRAIRPLTARDFSTGLVGRTIEDVGRRAKYVRIRLDSSGRDCSEILCHLGMTGRLFLIEADEHLPAHAAVVVGLGSRRLVFQDVRQFGRITRDTSVLDGAGPEPLDDDFPIEWFSKEIRRRRSPLKSLLLDQSLIAGVGNIYANEALFLSRIRPTCKGVNLKPAEVCRLADAIREVLQQAIDLGQSLSLDWKGGGADDGLFYFGSRGSVPAVEERFRVYGRAGEPCPICQSVIERVVISGRGSFYCPRCQR